MFSDSAVSLAEDGFFFLQNHVWSEVHSENDFGASVAAAKLILKAAEQKPDVMLKQSLDSSDVCCMLTLEDLHLLLWSQRQSILSVRTWNVLAFAALSNPSDAWASTLFAHFSTFSLSYNICLRPFGSPSSNPPEAAQTDINHAYSAVKLWLLLALKKFRLKGVSVNKEKDPVVLEDNEDAATRLVWNELWPPFALLVNFFEAEPQTSERSVGGLINLLQVYSLTFN